MVTIKNASKTDGCNAYSFDSGHNKQNIKKIECSYIAIYLCKVCREDMIKQLTNGNWKFQQIKEVF